MLWNDWTTIEFLIYTLVVFLVSSSLTVFFTNRDAIDEIIENNFEMWKRKDKKWYQVSFHRRKEKPKDGQRRLVPPLHAGGDVENVVDPFVLEALKKAKPKTKSDENIAIKKAWAEIIITAYPESAREHNDYMRDEYENMRARIRRKK